MQTVPAKWNDILAGDYQVDFKAVISGKTYTYGEIKSARITKSMMDKLTIGQATSAMLDMVFEPDGTIPTAAEIKCYIRLKDYGEEVTDWLPFGTFYIDTRSTDAYGWMTITAYDAMLKAEQDYIDNSGTYPMAMSDAVSFICGKMGVELDSRSQIAPYTVDSPTEVYTMREVLCGIAAASGGNFVITEEGKLRLIRLASPTNSDDVPVMSCDILGDTATIGKVTLYPDSNTQYSAGDSGYEIQADCIYATQEICNYVRGVLDGVKYLPYSAGTAFFNPALELGDSVKPNGNASIMASAAFTVGVSMSADIEAPIETEVNHEYPYQARTREERINARSFSEIRKSTEQIALEVSGKIDGNEAQALVDINLNGLTLSYTAAENGANITLSKDGVNITGLVKVGTITADNLNLTGAITFGDLSADLQTKIESSNVPEYIQATYIDFTKVQSPYIEANEIGLRGGYFHVMDSTGQTDYGYIGMGSGNNGVSSTNGIVMAYGGRTNLDLGGHYIIVTEKGVRMTAGHNSLYVTDAGVFKTVNGVNSPSAWRYLGDLMATLEETVWIYIYDNDTNKYLRSETHTLTEEISGSSIVPAETLAYKTYGTTYALKNCSATISGISWTHFGPDTFAFPDGGKITLFFVNRKYVADFSWTNDDAAKIKEGELPSNLKASAIKKVVDLLNGDLGRALVVEGYAS